MNDKKKPTRGGVRPGAGRPRKYGDSRSVTYRFPETLLEQIEHSRGDLSANEWVVDTLVKAIKGEQK